MKDGIFGDVSRGALETKLKEIQKAAGLPETGVYDEKTKAEILKKEGGQGIVETLDGLQKDGKIPSPQAAPKVEATVKSVEVKAEKPVEAQPAASHDHHQSTSVHYTSVSVSPSASSVDSQAQTLKNIHMDQNFLLAELRKSGLPEEFTEETLRKNPDGIKWAMSEVEGASGKIDAWTKLDKEAQGLSPQKHDANYHNAENSPIHNAPGHSPMTSYTVGR